MSSINFESHLDGLGLASDELVPVFSAFRAGAAYMAFSKDTPKDIVQRATDAYLKLLRAGEIPKFL